MTESGLRGKVPPNSIEAEKATLGAILMSSSALDTVTRYLSPDDFYKNANKKIYKAMQNLSAKSENVDTLTVIHELTGMGELDAAGGAAYISSLTSEVPTSANVEYYAKVVQQFSIRRGLIETSGEIAAGAMDDTMETGAVIEQAEKKIFEITSKQKIGEYRSAADILRVSMGRIQERMRAKSDCSGISSGYSELDSLTSGFQESELIIIGARPSVGKTALAISMAANMAKRNNVRVGFFSLEMDSDAIMQRFLSGESRVNSKRIRNGFLSLNEGNKLVSAAGELYKIPLYIADTPGMRLLDLRTEARKMKMKEDIQIIFVDYIGLITSENKDIPRHEQVAEISRSLKQLARELKIPIVVLCQVKREVRNDKPTLSDLRESGSIEQDADLVMFLHRANKKEERDGDDIPDVSAGQEIDLIVAKNRNGPIGDIKLMFLPAYTRFESISRDKE